MTLYSVVLFLEKRDREFATDTKLPKKLKKPKLIAEYTSSESESGEDDIDELLEEVLDQNDKMQKNKVPPVDPYPLFEADCRAAIARLVDLGDKSAEISILRVQLEVSSTTEPFANVLLLMLWF